ncbi:MAG: hypothetical protein GKR96_07175 [Gammaproteobacteria bacterium]|nr:hypothetical protein [Gammaproteobacteria bacterium]
MVIQIFRGVMLGVFLSGCATTPIPSGDIFDRSGIRNNIPMGFPFPPERLYQAAISLARNRAESQPPRNHTALVISRKVPGRLWYGWQYNSAAEAERSLLRMCNRKFGDCFPYVRDNIIVFDKTAWDATWTFVE